MKQDGRDDVVLADGGTIFFDEIAEMSLEHQAKVLRIAQEGTFQSVGGTMTLRVNVRIIAATNQELAEEVEKGRFATAFTSG